MTLGAKQRLFAQQIAYLIIWAYDNGYELTLAEAYRTPEQAALNARAGTGIANSLHTKRLALDLNLFKGGVFLTSSEAHRPLGEKWESMHELCRWGGRFSRPDGGHYSIEHEGVR